MEYRKLPHGDEQISVIGLGTSVVGEHSVQNVVETVTFALDSGVNYIDLAGGHAAIFPVIGSFAPKDTKGTCVYCKHCHPCPAGLDIGLINKYYDLSRLGDVLAKEHYLTLEKTASDCLQCGHCSSRCPFSVDQMARMEEIQAYFGR